MDINKLMQFGLSQKAFEVNSYIKFYEPLELEELIKNDIVLTITSENEIIGFLCCKIMSNHWAMLDNLIIKEEFRGLGYGKSLLNQLFNKLKEKKIEYLSTLVAEENKDLKNQMEHFGFIRQKSYQWMDIYLEST